MLRSERNAEWIERYCRIPEGSLVGQQVQLTAEQREWLGQIFDSPTRMFILSVGRKNAKTTFGAFLLLLFLCGPEHQVNGQLYSDAQSRDQAAILFALAAKMVRLSPELADVILVRDSAKQLFCPKLGTLYKALSAEVKTAFGTSPFFLLHDELGQVRGPQSDLYEAGETACAAHDNPISVIISTQAPTDADLLSVLIDDAISGDDPETKVVLYTADMDADPFSDEAIRQANPHFDVFMNQKEVRRTAENARRMPSRESSYRNLVLNQRVESVDPFISHSVWAFNGAEPDDDWGDDEVFAGLDLSEVRDLTAFVKVRVGEYMDVAPTFWLPSEGLLDRSRGDRVPYDQWAREGSLLTTPGRTVGYEYVARFIVEQLEEFNIKKIAFDRWNMRHLRPWLVRAGMSEAQIEEVFEPFGQGFQSMSPALRDLEQQLLDGGMRHGNHPVLTMCAANTVIKSDEAGNRKLDKKRSTGRIDGMVALTMALGVMPIAPTEEHAIEYTAGQMFA